MLYGCATFGIYGFVAFVIPAIVSLVILGIARLFGAIWDFWLVMAVMTYVGSSLMILLVSKLDTFTATCVALPIAITMALFAVNTALKTTVQPYVGMLVISWIFLTVALVIASLQMAEEQEINRAEMHSLMR